MKTRGREASLVAGKRVLRGGVVHPFIPTHRSDPLRDRESTVTGADIVIIPVGRRQYLRTTRWPLSKKMVVDESALLIPWPL